MVDQEKFATADVDIAALRIEYGVDQGDNHPGPETDLDADWLGDGWEPLLRNWIEDATSAGLPDPNAMVLSTVEITETGPRPSSRTVLCKGLSPEGVTFYTNYESFKGRQLTQTPYASATFVWPAMGRQVTVRGPVHRLPAQATEVYWQSRPRGSRLGAWASEQSRPVASRADLDRQMDATTARFADVDDVPVPPFWGGFQIQPETVEFWQGRRSRMHNRIKVTLEPGNTDVSAMKVERLQP
ncbi:pyridoxamine 5'-phosphate oxidase [Nocardia seriolae]|uniref:Pyridoxine/pyridoxamine 5'-phosphate oxidase n=1 Tax=Nocardia seriolae TaxID=37332 RepID=A0A0B8N6E8_9NOCA|nr:pyridoxamine 5'-phosphate oxidase [Nocardia seriolae]APB01797.1 Pyridoxal 5'-phosphate synthase [Nocardia seriolae]MTJ60745.1 pyridoxamine 5'-phosphate oxidase [Nocardia seriolae]MTJ70316.1 pyridoxamine 5'-phosphate oxidase [Nocardia seriolae]MTJ91110.1 pyridoxamine 5'-phosphate oxidase [Nocardia seriolae]MTK35072.1 pyridoxamine 5'-phosphate oxidase [Nocardia seriolae]